MKQINPVDKDEKSLVERVATRRHAADTWGAECCLNQLGITRRRHTKTSRGPGSASLHSTLSLFKKWLLSLFNHSSLVHRPVRSEINKSLARGTVAQAAGAGWGVGLLHLPFTHQNKCWKCTLLQPADRFQLLMLC